MALPDYITYAVAQAHEMWPGELVNEINAVHTEWLKRP